MRPRLFYKTFLTIIFNFALLAYGANFTILHTSDEHSSLVPTPLSEYLSGSKNESVGGFARLATLINDIRQQKNLNNEEVLLFSSGDFIGGTPFSWLILQGLTPEIEIMRKIGYDAATLGNHEFDYGPGKLANYLLSDKDSAPAFSLLCSNIVIPKDHPLQQSHIKAQQIFTLKNGLKIGVFAIMGKDSFRLAPTAAPVTFTDQYQSAREQIQVLKQEGAEVIIAITHAGYKDDVELAKTAKGIDLILGGHNHVAMQKPEIHDQTIIMHSGAYLQHVGQLDLTFDEKSRSLKLRNESTNSEFLHTLTADIEEEPTIKKLVLQNLDLLSLYVASFTAQDFTSMESVAVKSDFILPGSPPLQESQLGNFITDAMRLEVERSTGSRVDLAFHANGIIRGDLKPATSSNSRGDISFFDLATISGIGCGQDNQAGYALVSFYLSEKEILNILEIGNILPQIWGNTFFLQYSGLRYNYDPARIFWLWLPIVNMPLPAYSSVLSAEMYTGKGRQTGSDFKVISPSSNRLYRVVTTHYLASYLPMVGKKLPRLNLVLKDKNGQPTELEQAIIRIANREFKIWEAVARHAQQLAEKDDSPGQIPAYYKTAGSRIMVSKGASLWTAPAAIIIALLLLAILIRWQRGRR